MFQFSFAVASTITFSKSSFAIYPAYVSVTLPCLKEKFVSRILGWGTYADAAISFKEFSILSF